jgi:Protein of unknown function (DUF664)
MSAIAAKRRLTIETVPMYTPHIGVLVTTMERCREATVKLVADLTVAQLDYLFDAEDNSIGALLLHLAAIEAAYQELTFRGRNILDVPERIGTWHVPMYLDEPAREQIHGRPASYYLDELAAMRAETLAQFRQYDDSWLWQETEWDDAIVNNYWQWYHVYEDEINHRGEMRWRLSRMPATIAPR